MCGQRISKFVFCCCNKHFSQNHLTKRSVFYLPDYSPSLWGGRARYQGRDWSRHYESGVIVGLFLMVCSAWFLIQFEITCLHIPLPSDTLDLELQIVASPSTWVLGMKLRSTGRRACVLDLWDISIAPNFINNGCVMVSHGYSFIVDWRKMWLHVTILSSLNGSSEILDILAEAETFQN